MMGFIMISLNIFVILLFLCFGMGALLPLLTIFSPRRKIIFTHMSLAAALTGSLVTIGCAIVAWQTPLQSNMLISLISIKGQILKIAFGFYVDPFAALFLLLTGTFTLAVVLHLISWLEKLTDQHRIAAAFNLFVLSIVFTILSDTVYSFLFFQESMTLSFAYLVLFKHNTYLEKADIPIQELEASKTAFKAYLIFEHVGITLITIALLILSVQSLRYKGVEFDFVTFRNMAAQNPTDHPVITSLVFLFALAGFGIKAGVFPAHIWVPMVHPYSPTSIHAMMSGIALKVAGLYGMYRVFFYFLNPTQWWWGWLVLVLAGATALFGVFYAILAKDLKTALASHSVENIGIILAGIGLALIFRWEGNAQFKILQEMAALIFRWGSSAHIAPEMLLRTAAQNYFNGLTNLAIIASLYHLVNHSVFKGLLFFCAGAIENRLGVVALDQLGGLMKRYPLTSNAFLIGAVSIAGFPPFNGFVSEWLLLQTLFAGMDLYYVKERIFLLAGFVIVLFCLVLAFSLTALAFVKIAGETLLGAPRDLQIAKNARPGEVRWTMRIVLITFSAFCILLGIFPTQVTQQLNLISINMVPDYIQNDIITQENNIVLDVPPVPREIFQPKNATPTDSHPAPEINYRTRLSNRIILILGLILGSSIFISFLVGLPIIRNRRLLQFGPPWTGGIPFSDQLMKYTGTAFASLVWKPFENKPTPSVLDTDHTHPVSNAEKREILPYREFITSTRYIPEVIRQIYDDLLIRLLWGCEKIGIKAQPGDIRVYLQYIFLLFISILILLLVAVKGW